MAEINNINMQLMAKFENFRNLSAIGLINHENLGKFVNFADLDDFYSQKLISKDCYEILREWLKK